MGLRDGKRWWSEKGQETFRQGRGTTGAISCGQGGGDTQVQVSPPGSTGSERKRAEKAASAEGQLCPWPPGLVQALFPNCPQTLRSSDGAGKTLWCRWSNPAPDRGLQAILPSWLEHCSASRPAWLDLMDICVDGNAGLYAMWGGMGRSQRKLGL